MRYKIVACILILSGFVLAAPVPGQDVREAFADAVEGGENMIIVSRKPAPPGNPHEAEESGLYPIDSSNTEWNMPPAPQSSSDHASGSHPGVGMSSSPSGGTEVPLDSEGASKPGTTTDDQLASSSKTNKLDWGHMTKGIPYRPFLAPLPEDETLSDEEPWSDDEPSSYGEITSKQLPPGIEPLPLPPGREGYLAKVAAQQLSSPEIEQASPSSIFEPPPSSKSQSKGFVSKVKTFVGKLGELKFAPRF